MISTRLFARRLVPPGRFSSILFALAVPASMMDCAAQTAKAMPEAACPEETAENADAGGAECAVDATAVQGAAMLQSLDALSAHGLDPDTYATEGVGAREAWLLAATHLRQGVLDAETLAPREASDTALGGNSDALPPEADAAAYRVALEAFAPATPLYAALKAELERQRGLLAGEADPEALSATGARIDSLVASLERLRWLPRETTSRQIYANIPTFEVVALSGETEVSRHTAIFGEVKRPTPEFSDVIEYVEFSPWWNVPASIAREDSLPKFQQDPGEVERLGYKVLDQTGKAVDADTIDWDAVSATGFPYRLRQAPGAENALGQVKFMFPNPDSIYLHDTPEPELFSQEERAISAGCIRVQDALALAEWALDETPAWDRKMIDSVVGLGDATRAKLVAPMSIHIVYLTAFPGADGTMAYAPDVYGGDAKVLPALAAYKLKSEAAASGPVSER